MVCVYKNGPVGSVYKNGPTDSVIGGRIGDNAQLSAAYADEHRGEASRKRKFTLYPATTTPGDQKRCKTTGPHRGTQAISIGDDKSDTSDEDTWGIMRSTFDKLWGGAPAAGLPTGKHHQIPAGPQTVVASVDTTKDSVTITRIFF